MSMTNCPQCNVTFNAGLRICPQCRAYEAPFPDVAKALAAKAEAQLESGSSPMFVRQSLVDAGFPADKASQLVELCRRKVAKRTRSHGLRRLFAGLGCMLFGGIVLAMALLADSGGRGAANFLLFGAAVFLFGGFALVSGLLAVFTGRESHVAAPESIESLFS